MSIGSLFAGIGGIELGLGWAGFGPVVWQVELDEFCRKVLERHWPNTARFADIREVGAHNLPRVDLICGGFPCTDVSGAGQRLGLAGPSSSLWYEQERVLRELRPRWAVVENVAGGAKKWVDAVIGGLEQLGYETLPVPLSAAACGAPHLRRRVFIVGRFVREAHRQASSNSDREQLRDEPGRGGRPDRSRAGKSADDGPERVASPWRLPGPPEPVVRRVDARLPLKLDRDVYRPRRLKALGNSVVPQCAQVIGELIRMLELRP